MADPSDSAIAKSAGLWAPIVTPRRGRPWVMWTCVRVMRRDAIAAFTAGLNPSVVQEHLSRVRFARVTITEDKR